jgi:hypothetical protein
MLAEHAEIGSDEALDLWQRGVDAGTNDPDRIIAAAKRGRQTLDPLVSGLQQVPEVSV